MPYTLAKFFLWGLLMALAGGIVGWLLRSLKCRAEIVRARASTVDEAELERLRGRVANLEPLVAERDRLRMELADVRGSSAGALGFATKPEPSIIPDDAELIGVEAGGDAAQVAAFAHSGAVGAPITDAVDEADGAAGDESPAVGDAETTAALTAAEPEPAAPEPAVLDIGGAAAVLGKKIKADDLTVVEGIGPKIAELCKGIGVETWAQLAATEVAELQSMLDAAGSRFQMHKPASWPQQAGLLASGRWADFVALTESLSGGK